MDKTGKFQYVVMGPVLPTYRLMVVDAADKGCSADCGFWLRKPNSGQ